MLKRTKNYKSYILILIAIISLLFVYSAVYVAAADTYSANEEDSLPLPVHKDHIAMGFTAITDDTVLLSGGTTPESATVYYFLDKDINLKGNITVEGRVTLCLNGHMLSGRETENFNGPIITVKSGAEFTLCDCGGESGSTGSEHKYYVAEEGKYVFYEGDLPQEAPAGAQTGVITGGVITNGVLRNEGTANYASAVQVEESAVFNMESGTIAGNTVDGYGGESTIYIAKNAVFNMMGGSVRGNIGSGNNIYSLGQMYMTGGDISYNCAQTGGGVSSNGLFMMSGGEIRGNKARGGGGGVWASGGEFYMNGGNICENRVLNGEGGAAFISNCLFTMEGGTVSSNHSYNLTHGVYVGSDSTFNINGGYFSGKCSKEYDGKGININGGYFSEGNPENNSVEGIVVAENKIVAAISPDFGDENYVGGFDYAVYNAGETVIDLTLKEENPIYDGNALENATDFDASATYRIAAATMNAQTEFSYSAGGADFISGLPVNAGEYTLKVSVKEYYDSLKKYYCPAMNKTITLTVNKARPEYVIPEGFIATYGDSLSEVTLPSGWSWKDGGVSVGNAGERAFTAVYTPTDTENYLTAEENITVTVNKAKPSYVVPEGLTAVEGQKLYEINLPSGWTWEDDYIEVGEAGEKSFSAVFTPEDTENYSTVTVTLQLTVSAKSVPDSENTDPDSGNYVIPTILITVAAILILSYGVFAVLFKKGIVCGKFFEKIYPFIKK